MGKGKKKRQRERKNEGYPPEAKLVCDMLSSNTNPLVSITFVGPFNSLTGGINYPRSMGFIVERFDQGLRLIVTCKHVLSFFNKPAYRQAIAFKNPRPTILECIGSPIEDPLAENDVAFLLVRDPLDAPTKPFELHTETLPIVTEQTLYNAQNRCEPLQRCYEVFVAAQPVYDLKKVVFCKLGSQKVQCIPNDDQVRQDQLQQEGWISHRLLQMVSRPGYSGSPIWDNQLHLYGMDIRGSTPQDSFYADQGDVTVCLPTSNLYAARHRIDARLQQRLSKT